jgi:S1-C subfamily serine protease
MTRLVRSALLAALVAALAGFWLTRTQRTSSFVAEALPARPTTSRPAFAADEQAVIDLFKGASPSVVYITNVGVQRDFFSLDAFEVRQGTGSGFVWDEDGHIVTNFHVIQGAARAEVTFHDQSEHDAELVGVAPEKDIAVLRVKAPRELLRPLPIGTSRDLLVGQKTFAIGNPFGLDYTLTSGLVSALGREIRSVANTPITDVIQTDAAINPGNSGGPLLDSAGHLIGITTAIYSPSGASAGIGFAVPVDTVNRIVSQLIRYGKVIRPGLGVGLVPDHIARRLGIDGVAIRDVRSGGGAEQAGLMGLKFDRLGQARLGDVIVAIDGAKVGSADDLYRSLDGKNVGDRVKVEVRRGNRLETVEIALQAVN